MFTMCIKSVWNQRITRDNNVWRWDSRKAIKPPLLIPLLIWNGVVGKFAANSSRKTGHREPFTSLAQERCIKYVWESAIDEEATHKAILQFRKRLRAVVVNKGGPIQHLYRWLYWCVTVVLCYYHALYRKFCFIYCLLLPWPSFSLKKTEKKRTGW